MRNPGGGRPGKGWGGAWRGLPRRLAMARPAHDARLRVEQVACRGMAPAPDDVLAGAVPGIVIDLGTAAEMLRARHLLRRPAGRAAKVPTLAGQGPPSRRSGSAGCAG